MSARARREHVLAIDSRSTASSRFSDAPVARLARTRVPFGQLSEVVDNGAFEMRPDGITRGFHRLTGDGGRLACRKTFAAGMTLIERDTRGCRSSRRVTSPLNASAPYSGTRGCRASVRPRSSSGALEERGNRGLSRNKV